MNFSVNNLKHIERIKDLLYLINHGIGTACPNSGVRDENPRMFSIEQSYLRRYIPKFVFAKYLQEHLCFTHFLALTLDEYRVSLLDVKK